MSDKGGLHIHCIRCGSEEDAKRAVHLYIEGDLPNDEGTDAVLCRDCGVAATMLVADWLGEMREILRAI